MKSLLLLSGGLDSGVSLAASVDQDDYTECLFIDYGQRSVIEWESAEALCKYYGVKLTPVECRGVMLNSSLVRKGDNTLKSFEVSDSFMAEGSAYVPGRNLLFLGVALAFAESRSLDRVLMGITGDNDSTGLGDQDPKFLAAVEKAGEFAKSPVSVTSLLYDCEYRREVVAKGARLRVPVGLTYSCYEGNSEHCGSCEACVARILSFTRAGYIDPVIYARVPVWGEELKSWPIQ